MTSRTVNNRLSPRSLLLVGGVLAFALSGCAGAAVDTDTQPADPDTSAPMDVDDGDTSGEVGSGAGLGTITVDTTTYGVVEVVNCEPVQTSDLVTEVFDVIAVAQSAAGDDALFFAYTQEQSGAKANFIDYQGPEGTLSTPGGNATFVLDSGVLSGASSVVDDGNTQTFMIQFEFELPAELVDCE